MQKFYGNGEFSEYVLSRIQKLLKPIYDLTRKGRTIVWEKVQQDSFEEIMCRLIRPQVLHMPNTTGRFHLYSDTSKFATGSVLEGNLGCTISQHVDAKQLSSPTKQ